MLRARKFTNLSIMISCLYKATQKYIILNHHKYWTSHRVTAPQGEATLNNNNGKIKIKIKVRVGIKDKYFWYKDIWKLKVNFMKIKVGVNHFIQTKVPHHCSHWNLKSTPTTAHTEPSSNLLANQPTSQTQNIFVSLLFLKLWILLLTYEKKWTVIKPYCF